MESKRGTGKTDSIDVEQTKKNVYRFGMVSYLTDVSSETILGVFSVFFTTVMGGSTRLLGLLEGLADFCASVLDYYSGYLGDKTGQYKKVAVGGYTLSAIAKILLACIQTLSSAFTFRIIDRLGKSVRGSPRDAWLATVVSQENRGFAYALHKTFDKLGAITGPLIAFVVLTIMGSSLSSYRLLFLIATIPGILSVIFLMRIKQKKIAPVARENIVAVYHTFHPSFKRYVRCALVFGVAYFSFSFFLLKAYDVGFTVAQVALLYAVASVAFVLVAVPIGKFGDIVGRRAIIATSYLLFAAICVGFIVTTTKLGIIVLLILFGIFMAIDESQTKAYITDLERERRGSAIGFYNFVLAFGYVAASLIAGFLWAVNPAYTFLFSALVAFAAFVNFLIWM